VSKQRANKGVEASCVKPTFAINSHQARANPQTAEVFAEADATESLHGVTEEQVMYVDKLLWEERETSSRQEQKI